MRLRNLNLKTKIFSGFGVVGIAIGILGLIIFSAIVRIQEQNEIVRINTKLLGAVNQVKSTVLSDMLNINSIVELKDYDSINKYMNKHIEAQDIYTRNNDLVSAIIKDSISNLDKMDRVISLIDSYQVLHKTSFENYFQPAYDTMLAYMGYYLQEEYDNYTEPVDYVLSRKKELKEKRKEPLFICFNSGQKLFGIITDLEEALKKRLNQAQSEISYIINQTIVTTTILFIVVILVAIVVSISMAHVMVNPILKVMDFMKSIASGVLPDGKLKEWGDEIGTMSTQINNHISNLKACTEFAEEIGSGRLDVELEANDVLGLSLINMQEKLKVVAEEDKKRNYISTGLEKVNQVIRSSYDLSKISDGLIKTLVNTLNGYLGAIFIAENDNYDNVVLNLKAAYAYGRKKFVEKGLSPGQGLSGQAFLEGDTIYLKQIPEDYANITSGLGDCKPDYVIMVPLKTDRDILGILEIGGFAELKDYEISFLEEAASIIASAVAGIKINETNKRLLDNYEERA